MNRTYQSVWNDKNGTFVAVSETAIRAGKKSSPGASARVSAVAGNARFALKTLATSVMLAFCASVFALPVGGVVAQGGASISGTPGSTTITQTSQNVAINWQSFNIGVGEAVQFIQPNSSAVALNRVLGPDPSSIFGSMSANGKVFLLNPNGILFGQGAQVNVSGLVASTLNMTDGDFMDGRYQFAGNSGAAVLNQGTINAPGGYVALLGANVGNDGTIVARLGTVALAAGNAMTLDVAGDGLLNVTVSQGAVNALVENGGLIQADGGQVLLTAKSAGSLLLSAVNNTGVIQAQTIVNRNGTIMLMGDMQSGTVNVGGTLDASAPNGGNGGFIETSAATVNIANDSRITTAAPSGQTGTWLIDPVDFTIALAGGNITGATLSGQLVANNITISNPAGAGNGDIFVNDVVSWTAVPGTSPTTLTLNATRDVIITSAITAVDGNLVVCCGRDINVNAAIDITRGSMLLAANRNVNQIAAITSIDGNVAMCAGGDINITGALSSTRGTVIPSRSLAHLGVQQGLTFSAGNAATGPGVAGGGGAVNIAPPGGTVTVVQSFVVGQEVPVRVIYNPLTYTAPVIAYSLNFTTFNPLTVQRLVFPSGANKVADGTTTAIFTSFQPDMNGVVPGGGAMTLAGGTANYDTAVAGVNKPITYSGFTLGGVSAGFALPAGCCGAVTTTTGTIAPLPPGIPSVIDAIVAPGFVMGEEMFLATGPTWVPTVVEIDTPPRLLSLAPPPVPVVVPPPRVEEERPPIYVPPVLPRKQDRN